MDKGPIFEWGGTYLSKLSCIQYSLFYIHDLLSLVFRRFRKCAADNKIASSTCSVEGLVLNIKDELPENSLKVC